LDWEFYILVSGMVAEVALILVLTRGRVFRTFPAFYLFLCWSLFSDALLYYVRVHASDDNFFKIYRVQLVVDSLMIFALLVEVAWSVLRPIRNSLPKYTWVGIAVLVAVGGLILWPIAGFVAPNDLSPLGMSLFKLQQTPAILRAVFFLALAASSQLLSIGLRDRELQIATGLGFFSIVSLAVTILHTYQPVGLEYHWLDRAVSFSYIVALGYWVFSFATVPVERREFTPQMQGMLLAVAGSARATRVAMKDSTSSKTGNGRDR
jgi:hypothetical protein